MGYSVAGEHCSGEESTSSGGASTPFASSVVFIGESIVHSSSLSVCVEGLKQPEEIENNSAIGSMSSGHGGASFLFANHFVQRMDLYFTRFHCVFAFKVLSSAKKVIRFIYS